MVMNPVINRASTQVREHDVIWKWKVFGLGWITASTGECCREARDQQGKVGM